MDLHFKIVLFLYTKLLPHSEVFTIVYYMYTSQSQLTSLHWASFGGYNAIVQILLDAKADVNARDEVSTVLHVRISARLKKCLYLKLPNKVNPLESFITK